MSEVDNPMISTQELACILMKKQYDEMCEVLQWASENVLSAWGPYTDSKEWSVFTKPSEPQVGFHAPTLYQALKSAWEARDHEA